MEQYLDHAYTLLNNIPPSLCAICVGLILIVLKCMDKSGKVNTNLLVSKLTEAVKAVAEDKSVEIVTEVCTDQKENLYRALSQSLSTMNNEWALTSNGIANTALGVTIEIKQGKFPDTAKGHVEKDVMASGIITNSQTCGIANKFDEVMTPKHLEKLGPLAVAVKTKLMEMKGQSSAELITGAWAKIRLAATARK